MTNHEIQSLKQDFLAWSGGFEPESMHQISVYLDYACDSSLDGVEARHFLVTWMDHGDLIIESSKGHD